MEPGLSLARSVWLCSNSSANDSVIAADIWLNTQAVLRDEATHLLAVAQWMEPHRRGCPMRWLPEASRRRRRRDDAQRAGSKASTRSTTASMDRPVVSMRTASSAGRKGATARFGIAGVAGEDLAQQTGQCNGNPFVFQLLIAPFGPFFGAGRQEDLVGGVREDHRAHVPAVGDQARRAPEGALARPSARPGPRGWRRSPKRPRRRFRCAAHRWRPCRSRSRGARPSPSLEVDRRCRRRSGPGPQASRQVDVVPAGGHADGAVQRAGIEVMPAQAAGPRGG